MIRIRNTIMIYFITKTIRIPEECYYNKEVRSGDADVGYMCITGNKFPPKTLLILFHLEE